MSIEHFEAIKIRTIRRFSYWLMLQVVF